MNPLRATQLQYSATETTVSEYAEDEETTVYKIVLSAAVKFDTVVVGQKFGDEILLKVSFGGSCTVAGSET
jgi:hypothetical protein